MTAMVVGFFLLICLVGLNVALPNATETTAMSAGSVVPGDTCPQYFYRRADTGTCEDCSIPCAHDRKTCSQFCQDYLDHLEEEAQHNKNFRIGLGVGIPVTFIVLSLVGLYICRCERKRQEKNILRREEAEQDEDNY